jgi:LysR family glycine cleavage system transcriptional activator
MRHLPNLLALRAFVATARWQNIRQAADQLAVTHAAVSRHINNLEDELGVSLFIRKPQSLLLTDEGRAYYESVAPAFAQIGQATLRIRSQSRCKRARIRLAVDPPLAVRWLLPRLNTFREIHPNIEIDLIPDNSILQLPHPTIDAAIHYGDGIVAGDGADCLMTENVFAVCSPKLLRTAKIATPADFARTRLLHEVTTYWWQRWFEVAGVENVDLNNGPVFHDGHLVLEAAAIGEGVAIGDDVLAGDDLATGRLVKPFDISFSGKCVWLLWDASDPDPSFQSLREWLLGICAERAMTPPTEVAL